MAVEVITEIPHDPLANIYAQIAICKGENGTANSGEQSVDGVSLDNVQAALQYSIINNDLEIKRCEEAQRYGYKHRRKHHGKLFAVWLKRREHTFGGLFTNRALIRGVPHAHWAHSHLISLSIAGWCRLAPFVSGRSVLCDLCVASCRPVQICNGCIVIVKRVYLV